MTNYNYNITDFLNDLIDVNTFNYEVRDSTITSNHVGTTYKTEIDIEFETDLTIDEKTTLDNLVAAHDGQPRPDLISTYVESTAMIEVTPSNTTEFISGPFHLMQTLINRRELFNDKESPIYEPTLIPILGEDGHLVDHANRINNLEVIHGKLGWHRQQMQQAKYTKPDNLLIYYGWLSSFNNTINTWDNEKIAQDMAKYNLIVLGDGVADTGHGDYTNASIIISRIKELNPSALIFGYVSINQNLVQFQFKVDEWEMLQIHGIFLDEAGYDYGNIISNSRSAFNTKIDYVHNQTYAKLCFANAWNIDHVLGTVNDPAYPNTTYNTSDAESNLTENDYFLLESFAVNSVSYTSNYESKTDWCLRGIKAINHRYKYGINLIGSCVIEEGHADANNLLQFAFISSLMFSMDGFGSSDIYYSSSSAHNTFISRTLPGNLGTTYTLTPTVIADGTDTDVYHRYTQFGHLKLDFSTDAQTFSIINY